MSFHYSPKIVTGDMRLCLDANDVSSYPGTGATWYDISGNDKHATLVGGPVYTAENGSNYLIKYLSDHTGYYMIRYNNSDTIQLLNNILNFQMKHKSLRYIEKDLNCNISKITKEQFLTGDCHIFIPA